MQPPFEFARFDVPLGPLTRYDVGGPARVLLTPPTADAVREAYAWMLGQPGPRLVLGGGSNVLIDSAGFPGVVLSTAGLTELADLGGGRWRVGAGVDLARLVSEVMLPRNYDGVGALTGIPGSVGGAIYMNAGTVNGSTCALMESVDVLGAAGVETRAMHPGLYGYRGQSFCPPDAVILGGVFAFAAAEADQGPIHARYLARRAEKQPRGHCCGSVFKNPEGEHAGRLIEACGLKGLRRGGACISQMHANFIMNEGGATSGDILWLMARAKAAVRERFGITLEEEVRVIRAV